MYRTLNDRLIAYENREDMIIVFIDKEEKIINYKELLKKSRYILNGLYKEDISKGDEVILQINDNEKFIYLFFACIMGGIIPIPIENIKSINDERLFEIVKRLKRPSIVGTKKEIDIITDKCSKEQININKVLHIDELLKENVQAEIINVSENDIALIQFSSGSTGNPKGVALTHKNLICNIEAVIKTVGMTKGESFVSWLPLTHVMGLLGNLLLCFWGNMTYYNMQPLTFLKDPILWLKTIEKYRGNYLTVPNFALRYTVDYLNKNEPIDLQLGSIKKIFNGAEPISIDLIEEFTNYFKKYGLKDNAMYPVYGLSEVSLAAAFPEVDSHYEFVEVSRKSLILGNKVNFDVFDKSDSIKLAVEGTSLIDVNVKITDRDNNELNEDTLGIIKISGESVTKGYYNDEILTKELIDRDGWLNTTDLGFIHHKKLVVIGRYSEIIYLGGINYFPYDLEEIVTKNCNVGVGEVAFSGIYNEFTGIDDVVCFIINHEISGDFIEKIKNIEDSIFEVFNVNVAYVVPVDKIEKTSSGKLKRYTLKRNFEEGKYQKVLENIKKAREIKKDIKITAEYMEDRLKEIWKKTLDNSDFDKSFYESGGSSLKLIYMLDLISRNINIPISLKEFNGDINLYKLKEMLLNKVQNNQDGVKANEILC